MIQFNNIDIYMKTLNEKEKKLSDAIEKLNNLEFQSHNLADEIVTLDHQKNQLELLR